MPSGYDDAAVATTVATDENASVKHSIKQKIFLNILIIFISQNLIK
jgi:hypothetical protein